LEGALTRLQRLLQPVNWKYAVGELVLIVLGILVALAANAWYARYDDRREEREYLREIRAALQADLSDVRANVAALKQTQLASNRLGNHLQARLPLNDSIREDLGRLTSSIMHVQNRGAYESLKTRGLNLIRDDSLRFAISQLYEGQYRFLETIDATAMQSWAMSTRELFRYIVLGPNGAMPRNYEQLLGDADFMAWLDWWRMSNNVALNIERNLERQITDVTARIDRALR
jgi:hypothetical protein